MWLTSSSRTCYAAFKTLYQWVHDVRGNRRRGKLAADRVRRLDELGFVWNPSNPNAPTVPVPTGNFLTVKRKRGRPRKADVEAALVRLAHPPTSSHFGALTLRVVRVVW